MNYNFSSVSFDHTRMNLINFIEILIFILFINDKYFIYYFLMNKIVRRYVINVYSIYISINGTIILRIEIHVQSIFANYNMDNINGTHSHLFIFFLREIQKDFIYNLKFPI